MQKTGITNNTDLLQSCIWYNSKISKNPIYFPDWFNHGIYYVRDLLDAEGKMLTYEHLKMKYNCSLNIYSKIRNYEIFIRQKYKCFFYIFISFCAIQITVIQST